MQKLYQCLAIVLTMVSLFVSPYFAEGQQSYVQTVSAKRTLLQGQLAHPTAATIQLHFTKDYITSQQKIYEIPLDEDGSFRYEFDLKTPTMVIVQHGDYDMEVYLEPGDALQFNTLGASFLEAVEFTGKAAFHNAYLRAAEQEFADWNEAHLLKSIATHNALNFRLLMDKYATQKRDFYEQANSENFSEDFQQYAEAAIDYWQAYYLMRYRYVYPKAHKMTAPMTLPASYFDFLLDLDWSNDVALMNADYRSFLDIFLAFVEENPTEWQQLEAEGLVVTNSTVMLLEGEHIIPLAYTLDKGKRLQLADDRLRGDKANIDPNAHYKIHAPAGLAGWIRGQDIAFINRNPNSDKAANSFTERREVEKRHVEMMVEGRYSKLEIRAIPHEQEAIGYLYEGEQASFLLIETHEKFPYRNGGQLYLDYFFKIRKKDGTEGWIPKSGLRMVEREVTTRELKDVSLKLSNENAKNYLTGQSLYYALGKDIYNRLLVQDGHSMRQDVFNYLRLNPVERYDDVIQYAYEDALRRAIGKQARFTNKKEERLVIKPRPKMKDETVRKEARRKKGYYKSDRKDLVQIDNMPCDLPRTTTSLKGKMKNVGQRKIKFTVYLDQVLYQEDTRELRINTDGTFELDWELTEPVLGELIYDKKRVPLFLNPGDQLELKVDVNEFDNTLIFNGIGGQKNNYLHRKKRRFGAQEEEMKTKLQYANEVEFTAFMDKAIRERKAFFTNFSQQFKLGKSFEKIEQADLDYWYAFSMLNYTYEHPLWQGKSAPMRLPDTYYAFLKELPISVEDALPSLNYSYFLSQYVEYQYTQTTNKKEREANNTIARDNKKAVLAKQHLKAEAYYYFMAKQLAASCRRGELKQAGPAIQQFITNCPYDTYNNILRFSYNEALGLMEGTAAPDFTLSDVNGKEVSLSDLRGKVVYIDFWATWCAPCLRYMPASQELSKKYEDKDVVFLYISLDDRKEDWIKYVKNRNLHGTHVASSAGYGYHAKIAELYKVQTLPAYFLVDKAGKIALSEAPTPGAAVQLEKAIDTLLEE